MGSRARALGVAVGMPGLVAFLLAHRWVRMPWPQQRDPWQSTIVYQYAPSLTAIQI